MEFYWIVEWIFNGVELLLKILSYTVIVLLVLLIISILTSKKGEGDE